jgi:hypothetical protein
MVRCTNSTSKPVINAIQIMLKIMEYGTNFYKPSEKQQVAKSPQAFSNYDQSVMCALCTNSSKIYFLCSQLFANFFKIYLWILASSFNRLANECVQVVFWVLKTRDIPFVRTQKRLSQPP